MHAAERYASEWIDLLKEIIQCLRIANQPQPKQVNRFQQDRTTPVAWPMKPPMDSTLLQKHCGTPPKTCPAVRNPTMTKKHPYLIGLGKHRKFERWFLFIKGSVPNGCRYP